MKKTSIAALIVACAAMPAFATSQAFTHANENYALPDVGEWHEGDYTPPPYPVNADWLGFYVPLKPDFKFFIDSKTLTVGQDGAIRVIMRATTARGAENVSLEGFQCANRTMRTYAFGDGIDKVWIQSTKTDWKRMNRDDSIRMRLIEDLCPDWSTPADAAQAISRVKKAPWN